MSKKKESKEQAKKKIEEFFSDLSNKTPEEIRKIKKLAMSHNLKLRDLRKQFCQKCYSTSFKIKSIKHGIKTLQCSNCKKIMRWKIN